MWPVLPVASPRLALVVCVESPNYPKLTEVRLLRTSPPLSSECGQVQTVPSDLTKCQRIIGGGERNGSDQDLTAVVAATTEQCHRKPPWKLRP